MLLQLKYKLRERGNTMYDAGNSLQAGVYRSQRDTRKVQWTGGGNSWDFKLGAAEIRRQWPGTDDLSSRIARNIADIRVYAGSSLAWHPSVPRTHATHGARITITVTRTPRVLTAHTVAGIPAR